MSTEADLVLQLFYGVMALCTMAMGAAIIYGFAIGIGEWYDAAVGVAVLICGIALTIIVVTGQW